MLISEIDKIQNDYIRAVLRFDPRSGYGAFRKLLSLVTPTPVTWLTHRNKVKRACVLLLAKISPENSHVRDTKDAEMAAKAFKKLNAMRENYLANSALDKGMNPNDFPEISVKLKKRNFFERLLRKIRRFFPQREVPASLAIPDQRSPAKKNPKPPEQATVYRARLFSDASSAATQDVLDALNLASHATMMPLHVAALYKRRPDLVASTLRAVLIKASENNVFEGHVSQLLDTVVDLLMSHPQLCSFSDYAGCPPLILKMLKEKLEIRFSQIRHHERRSSLDVVDSLSTIIPHYRAALSGKIRGLIKGDISADPSMDRNVSNYKIYTTDFDEIVRPNELVSAEKLAINQQTIERRHGLYDVNNPNYKIAHEFNEKLQAAIRARMSDEGIAPGETTIALLLDNSGSLRGHALFSSLLLTSHTALALEVIGAKTEILGFTTAKWKGGQSRERWLSEGRPSKPGRLNDLRHIIYKKADEPWEVARTNLACMFEKGILKENIDGEALLWVEERLDAQREKAKSIVLISDGAPVDDATLSVNGSQYLQEHFTQTANCIQERTSIKLGQIYVGDFKGGAIAICTNVPADETNFYAEVDPEILAHVIIPPKFKMLHC